MKITEDYVSFETAKLLKEKGFKVETEHELWYVAKEFSTGCHWNSCTYKVGETTREYDRKYCISMPTLQMAMKWLRDVHKCIITFSWGFENRVDDKSDFSGNIVWSYNIAIAKHNSARKGNGDYFDMYISEREDYPTYEEACEAGIKHCLEKLV